MHREFGQARDPVTGPIVRVEEIGEQHGLGAAGVDVEQRHQHRECSFGGVGSGEHPQRVHGVAGVSNVEDNRVGDRVGEHLVFAQIGAVHAEHLGAEVDRLPENDFEEYRLAAAEFADRHE